MRLSFPNAVLTTPRTYLRFWTKDDFRDLKAIFGDPAIMDPVGSDGALNDEQVVNLLDFFIEQYAQFGFGPMAVVSIETNQVIGINGIKKLAEFEYPDLGFAFLKNEWRKGYAKETSVAVIRYAFDDLKLKALCAIVHPHNHPSIQLLTKLGFTLLRSGERKSHPICVYQKSN